MQTRSRLTAAPLAALLSVLGGCASARLAPPPPASDALVHTDAGPTGGLEAPPSLDVELARAARAAVPPAPQPAQSRRYGDGGGRWAVGHTAMQGWLGVAYLDKVKRTSGGFTELELDEDELRDFPAIGGGGQWKLGGRRVDFGFETMINFSWSANATAFAAGGGGAVVVVDVDVLMIDLFGGPYASLFLGERMRLYASAGPLLQWSDYDQTDDFGETTESNGFGSGGYARGGVEFQARPGLWLGLGARWTDSSVSLGNDLGNLEVSGTQVLFTVTTGL